MTGSGGRSSNHCAHCIYWVPAFAGTTAECVVSLATNQNCQIAKRQRPYCWRRRVRRRPFRLRPAGFGGQVLAPRKKPRGWSAARRCRSFVCRVLFWRTRAPLGAPSRRLFRPGSALSNWSKPACQRTPRTRVVLPGGRGPGAARGAWVTFAHARGRRIADVGFTRYRPTNGGPTITTPHDSALGGPDRYRNIYSRIKVER
jgi:hypothetical protein